VHCENFSLVRLGAGPSVDGEIPGQPYTLKRSLAALVISNTDGLIHSR